jgi:hypothetical protein
MILPARLALAGAICCAALPLFAQTSAKDYCLAVNAWDTHFREAINFAANGLALFGACGENGCDDYGDSKYGYINERGEEVIAPRFDQAEDFAANGLARVKAGRWNGKWGYIDEQGEFVIPPRFDDAKDFANGLARVSVDDEWGSPNWGYIDKQGKEVIASRFEYADDFADNGLARVGIRDESGFTLPGYINRQGEEILTRSCDARNAAADDPSARQRGWRAHPRAVKLGVRTCSWSLFLAASVPSLPPRQKRGQQARGNPDGGSVTRNAKAN